MEIDNKLNELFTEKKTEKQVVKGKDSTEFDIKNIEFNLNKHLREKQKLKYKKVNICDSDSNHMYNEEELSKRVDNEIYEKFKTKKWSSIPLYMKWNLVKQYLEDNKINEKQIPKYKSKLSSNKLDIEYDHTEQKITNIVILE